MSTTQFFVGLKVIDLSTVLAGPSVGSFFAEMGAEVIKLESPQGDVTKTWFANGENKEELSAYYRAVNHNKVVAQIDLNSEREKLSEYLKDADVLLTNFKEGDDIKFQLTEAHIRSIQPNIIIAKIQGFEKDTQRVAYDVVLQAETGFMAINGEKDSNPLKMPVALMDVLAAHQLKEGILCALLHKATTGKGSTVSCSLEMAGMSSLMNQASIYLKSQIVPQSSGSLHPTICPYGEIIRFKDDVQIVLAIGSNRQFADLCLILGLPELAADVQFENNAVRVTNRMSLIKMLQQAADHLNSSNILPSLLQRNVPFGRIKTMDEVMEQAHKIGAIKNDTVTSTPYVKSVAFDIRYI